MCGSLNLQPLLLQLETVGIVIERTSDTVTIGPFGVVTDLGMTVDSDTAGIIVGKQRPRFAGRMAELVQKVPLHAFTTRFLRNQLALILSRFATATRFLDCRPITG